MGILMWMICGISGGTEINKNSYAKGRFRGLGFRSRVPSYLRSGQSMLSQPLRAWKLRLTTSYGFSSPKYNMNGYMATLLGGEAWGSC